METEESKKQQHHHRVEHLKKLLKHDDPNSEENEKLINKVIKHLDKQPAEPKGEHHHIHLHHHHDAEFKHHSGTPDPLVKWGNYGGTNHVMVERYYPETIEAVSKIIVDAVKNGRKVRAVGDGHSWSPIIAEQGGILVHLKKGFDHIDVVQKGDDHKPTLVKLGPGVTTGDLARWFDHPDRGDLQYMGLAADVVLDKVNYGGVYMPACHGASNRPWSGNCADILYELEYVNYAGQLVKKTRPSIDDHQAWAEWIAVSANFGLIGIVVSLTFVVETKRKIVHAVTSDDLPISFFCENPKRLKDWVTLPDVEAIEFFWWPLNGATKVKTYDPLKDKSFVRIFRDFPDQTVKPKTTWGDCFDQTIRDSFDHVEVNVGRSLAELARTECGPLQIFYAKAALTMMAKKTVTASRSGAMHYQKHIADWTVNDIEICVKLNPDWSNLTALTLATIRLTEKWIKEKKRNPVNIAMEWRLTRGCRSALMSPAYTQNENDWFVWIEVLCSHSTEHWWEGFALEMKKVWCEIEPNCKPHWCKWWDHPDAKGEWRSQSKRTFAEQIAVFKTQINKLDQSPNHVFRSKFWEEMLS